MKKYITLMILILITSCTTTTCNKEHTKETIQEQNITLNKNYKVVRYGDCQYIEHKTIYKVTHNTRATHSLAHKGDCDNPRHHYNISIIGKY